MKKILLFSILLISTFSAFSQQNGIEQNKSGKQEIIWMGTSDILEFDESYFTVLNFQGAEYQLQSSHLPFLSKTIYASPSTTSATTTIVVKSSEPLNEKELLGINNESIPNTITAQTKITWYRKKAIATFTFTPLYKDRSTGQIFKVTSYSYSIQEKESFTTNAKRSTFKINSVLRSGTWTKVGTVTDGIYSLSYQDLLSLGLNVSGISSSSIRFFGNGGGYLPFQNSEPRLDDLEENAIEVVDGGDGIFNDGDYLLFYGQSPHRWKADGNRFNHYQHFFSDTTYYFITIDYKIGAPKRITKKALLTTPTDITVTTFNAHQYHEVDLTNFVKSGRNWYGESFSFTKNQSFGFNFPNAIRNTANLKSRLAFRAIGRSSTFTMSVNGTDIQSLSYPSISGHYYEAYAGIKSGVSSFTLPSANFSLDVNFSNPSSSDNGWIDYFEINCERALTLSQYQMPFRNLSSINPGVIQYNLSGSNYRIWNVTSPTNVYENTLSGNTLKENGGQLNQFVAFTNGQYLSPVKFGMVPNQDLHGLQPVDYVIITHPLYISQANQLANFHRTHSKLSVHIVTTQQIYNEFSSGSQDITAIKMFNKMLYDRAGSDPDKMLRYVLLLGDGSYDYKNRKPNNTNQVPSYQSSNSEAPLSSYVSDDYFGFLDNNEGDALNSTLDIGIGRIMAKNVIEAQNIIDKTIHYMSSPNRFSAFRNRLTFVGDDEDGVTHMDQSDQLARKIDTNYGQFNITKIYLDAYQQVSNAGGSTYPDVNTAIDNATEKGSMIINYTGHGGELGWTHERVLGLSQINNYKNINTLALYVTATCEFSRFDDPDRTSAGEYTLLNPNGSALGLLTTTRLVYSTPNFALAQRFFDAAFEKIDGDWPRLGDLSRISKINGSSINTRNFTMLGDPAAQLGYPEYRIQTTSTPDSLKSLQKITISGEITDDLQQKITNFNGTVYPTIYGQKKKQTTLNNDGYGPFEFETQENALFKGKASVINGEFTFSFIVPKDINFKYGYGKISYYAENGSTDASGFDNSIIIGGIDGDPNLDQTGPTIDLWMNDESFVMGGLTDENPLLYAKVFDESGINTVGNGIGHDIVAVIDENTANPIILNDYYETELDSYKKGSISYNLSNLSEGKHTLRLKVWDVYNNSQEAVTEFVVSKSSGFQIDHVLNYPNPFTTNTDFYFDHNAIGQQLKVRIQIFTVSGKLVKTIDHVDNSESFKVGPINWDGRDQYGDRIGKGTYVYRVKVTNAFDQTIEKFEKIVIL